MIDFIVKSSTSLLVFLIFYYLILQNAKMHQFNRFFLLLTICFLMILPFVSFEIIQEIPESVIEIGNMQAIAIASKSKNNNFHLVIRSIYLLVTLVLLIRFNLNILNFYWKIKANEIRNFKTAKLVLLNEDLLPHTFLKYIFINQKDFENRKIEPELFTHELTHVNQKHSLDVLFIEFLKVIFWFNLIFYMYKKAIQLNHEFLADANVNQIHQDISLYQTLLLSKTNNLNFQLASNLNYSLTKKRFIMMTKASSKTSNLFRKILVLPIFIALTILFCVKTVAQVKKPIKKVTNKIVITKNKPKQSMKKPKKEVLMYPKIDTSVIVTDVDKSTNVSQDNDLIYNTTGISVTDQPEFAGGKQAFFRYIGQNYKIPVVDGGLNGTIYVAFVVEKDGHLTDFKVLRDLGFGSGEEAIRVLKSAPKWKPAMLNGQSVRCLFQLPIKIVSLED